MSCLSMSCVNVPCASAPAASMTAASAAEDMAANKSPKIVTVNYSHVSDESFTLGHLKDWIIPPTIYMESFTVSACIVCNKQQTWDFCLENLKHMDSKVVTFIVRDSTAKVFAFYDVTVDFV